MSWFSEKGKISKFATNAVDEPVIEWWSLGTRLTWFKRPTSFSLKNLFQTSVLRRACRSGQGLVYRGFSSVDTIIPFRNHALHIIVVHVVTKRNNCVNGTEILQTGRNPPN